MQQWRGGAGENAKESMEERKEEETETAAAAKKRGGVRPEGRERKHEDDPMMPLSVPGDQIN